MGIQVEFNTDLALRNISFYQKGSRQKEECIPEPLKKGERYPFLKKGQRNYWFKGEIPLLETKGEEQLSLPIASIRMVEATHFKIDEEVYTKGVYEVIEVFDIDDSKAHFNGFAKVS